ncbi:MAG: LCP family protein [Oscillospiraceae bacterium]|nr:LCP family protein [Oscillospiraceae bacterium]
MEDLSQRRKEREAAMRRKKNKARKTTLIVICAVLALILALLVAGVVYFESLLGLINRADEVPQETMSQEEYEELMNSMKETIGDDFTGDVLHEDDVEWGSEVELIESGDDVLNVLLIGQDRRSEEQGRSRSDVIILCTVNKPAKTLTITSFMRDMYVQIPGYEDNRINVPYVLGGMDLLDRTLSTNFGVEVDGNVEVDFYGFIGIIDLMGGIEMDLTQAEANYMNLNYSWDVDDGKSKVWNLKEGVNQLTGSQALSYARMRYVGNGDYERTERQRRVLSALVEKAKELSITELNLLLQHALPMITTDMENQEILNYALELFPMLPELTVTTLRIPADGAYQSTYVREMAVLLPNLAKNRSILEEAMKVPGGE